MFLSFLTNCVHCKRKIDDTFSLVVTGWQNCDHLKERCSTMIFGLISNGNLKIHLKAELLHATALHLGQLVEPTKDKMDLSLGILAALLQLSSHSHQKGPKNRKHNYSYCAMEIGHKILLRNVQSVSSEWIVSNVTFQLLKNWVERISLPQNSYSLL